MDGLADGNDGEQSVTIALTRDPTYFLDCDCIFLKVENTLFKIPLYPLLKYSQPLRDLSLVGFSEADPFVVDNISVKEFRHFLRIIIPSVTEHPEIFWRDQNPANLVSKDEWISVLKISTLWHSLILRDLAISKLGELTGVEKIVLGRRYSISCWVEAGYQMMVQKKKITDEDMEEIGAVESFKLMRIIYEQNRAYDYRSSDDKVKETFQAELQSIAAKYQSEFPPVRVLGRWPVFFEN